MMIAYQPPKPMPRIKVPKRTHGRLGGCRSYDKFWWLEGFRVREFRV